MLHPEIYEFETIVGQRSDTGETYADYDNFVLYSDFEKLREEYAVQIKSTHDLKLKLDHANDQIAQFTAKIDTLATKLHCERAFLNDLMSRMRTLHELTAIESKPRTWPTKEMTQKLRDAGVIP